MSTTRKNILVTDEQAAWLKAQVASGAYTNESEAVRDLIRRAQAESDKDAIIAALIKGEESGESDLMPEDVRQRVLKRLKGQGSLGL